MIKLVRSDSFLGLSLTFKLQQIIHFRGKFFSQNLKPSEVSGSLDFLFLDPDLDDLLLLELLELLLLRDQEVFFVGSGLLGDGVEGRGHRLVVDDVGGEGGRGLDDLVLEEVSSGIKYMASGLWAFYG